MQWYAHQVANHPSAVILLVLAVAGGCLLISLTTKPLPTFKDPLLGFEPRGTVLSQRATAWRNLLDSSAVGGPLSMYPTKLGGQHQGPWAAFGRKGGNISRQVEIVQPQDVNMSELVVGSVSPQQSSPWMALENEEQQSLGRLAEDRKEEEEGIAVIEGPTVSEREHLGPAASSFFCNDPGRAYAHVVMQAVHPGENLFTLHALLSVCRLEEQKLRRSSHFGQLCEQTPRGTCCRSWSVTNYVALLRNRSSCHELTEADVGAVLRLLRSCAPFYHNLKLSHDCADDPMLCRGVPKRCIRHNAVYNVLHYLTDVHFLAPATLDGRLQADSTHLSYTGVFLPLAQSSAALPYYRDLKEYDLSDGVTSVVAMELGLKQVLFEECLLQDTMYVGLAGAVIFVLIWAYTASFVITVTVILSVLFALGFAYFMYTTVYQMPYFPFMNVLAVIIALGIGADDAFIYCKIWLCGKAEKSNGTTAKLVHDTLHHASLSMLVTSVTTAGAFFGSFTSHITAIRCFSIFAGTTVLANFLFTVTWLPSAVVMSEKWCGSSCCCLCIPPFGIYFSYLQRFFCCSAVCNVVWKMHYGFTDSARVFFEKILPCLIIKPRCFWVILLTALAICSGVVVFYRPRLRLPVSREFQVFGPDHPFERYDMSLKMLFWFEKAKERDLFHKLPIRVVWGVLPVDNGNYLDPADRGSLVTDREFDMAAPESQEWLLGFCKRLRNQSFYQSMQGPLLPNCFIETFKSWMERRCVDGISPNDRSPCCESSIFPYSRSVFRTCIRQAIAVLHHTPGYYFIPGVAGLRFSTRDGSVTAVVIEYDSIYGYSDSFEEMKNFRDSVDSWMAETLSTAPPGMRGGWFTSDLDFFDLQESLADGTVLAMGVAVCMAFAALLLTTLNLLISVFAIFTIACIILVTVASLVLLGWKLNVVESTTVSVAIGLAVDFTIHYGIAYRLSPQEDRDSSVVFAVSHVGSPVAMAAFTTFAAGLLVFPSRVLAYLQIGTFLTLVMAVSWFYATFYFQALLSMLGPQKGQLQLDYPAIHCCDTASPPADKATYALSESTLSTSSASYPAQVAPNESHELEPLTPGKLPRTEHFKYSKRLAGSGRGGSSSVAGHRQRPRSGSLSVPLSCARDPIFAIHVPNTSRKVSLPTVSVTFHGDPSPRHVSGATSSSTIICTEEDREVPCDEPKDSGWMGGDAVVTDGTVA